MADSVLCPASKARALEITWEKVNVDKFSREMMSLRNFLKVSFSPIMKISLCRRSSACVGKLHFWYSRRMSVCQAWMLIPGYCFEQTKKVMSALNYRLFPEVVLR